MRTSQLCLFARGEPFKDHSKTMPIAACRLRRKPSIKSLQEDVVYVVMGVCAVEHASELFGDCVPRDKAVIGGYGRHVWLAA